MTAHDVIDRSPGAARRYFAAARAWLECFPLSVIQLAMRVAMGSVFFNSGLLKIRLVGVRHQAVRGRVQSTVYRSDVGRTPRDLQRAHLSGAFVSRPCNTPRHTAAAWHDVGDPDLCLPAGVDRAFALGLRARLPADARSGRLVARSPHRSSSQEARMTALLRRRIRCRDGADRTLPDSVTLPIPFL